MSLSDRRDAIVAALSTVDGVKGYPKAPQAPRTGDAWPGLVPEFTRGPGMVFYLDWSVYVALPGQDLDAAQWIEEHLFELVDALQPLAHVTAAGPAMLPVPNAPGGMSGLEITMRGES